MLGKNIIVQCAPNSAHHLHVSGLIKELALHHDFSIQIITENIINNRSVFEKIVDDYLNVSFLTVNPRFFSNIESFIRLFVRSFLVKNRQDALIPFISSGLEFDYVDVVVVTDLILAKKIKPFFPKAKLVWAMHGAVSSGYISSVDTTDIDLILVSGLTTKNTFRGSRSKIVDIGSIKLEQCASNLNKIKKLDLFKSDGKTFLYNPHFNAKAGASSWLDHGVKILEFFSKKSEFNLIFSPHPYLGATLSDDLYVNDFNMFDNIHIDLSGNNTSSMSYSDIVDAYIGDVSSHCLEYMALKPREFIFHTHENLSPETLSMQNNGFMYHDFDSFIQYMEKGYCLSKLERDNQIKFINTVYSPQTSPSKLASEHIVKLLN